MKTTGYVVFTPNGLGHIGPADRYESKFPQGILWLGAPATIFKTKRAAERAIARTKKYRDTRYTPTSWPWYDLAYASRIGVVTR